MHRIIMQDHDHSFRGHQLMHPSTNMRHPDDYEERPSRLMQMKEDYQRRLLKEKEERMLNMYENNQRKNQEITERLTKGQSRNGHFPNSRLRQPGYMQSQLQEQESPSVRDIFRERRQLEANGSYIPPINQHFNQNKRKGSGVSRQKNSAGVDRANPLAPIQARHSGISSAPNKKPVVTRPRLVKQASSSPVLDDKEKYNSNHRQTYKPSPRFQGNSRANQSGAEKMSDFQKWQMEQNKAREDRLKKLNMRATPPSGRESGRWNADFQYEDDEVETDTEQNEMLRRQEQELMQRIAQQQAALSRLRKEREEEEELERQEAEFLRKQQAAEQEQRRQLQQEAAHQQREEAARARREEEEQRREARARQERQRYETLLNQQEAFDGDEYANQPNTYRSSNRGSSLQATPRYAPQPPPGMSPRHQPQQRHQRHAPPRQQPPRHNQPPPQRRPAADVEEEEITVPGPGADFYAQAIDGEQGIKMKLMPCKLCGRKFAADRIQKHQSACKNAQKKRSVMDPTQMRTDGTDMAKYVRQGAHQKEPMKKKKADWRAQHKEFIANIRYAKKMQEMEQKGVSLKDLPPPPPSQNPDFVPCPHCGRTFNDQAAERHIPRCQGLKTRPVGNRRR